MVDCQVLRCQSVASELLIIESVWGHDEKMVCREHHEAIKRGERWTVYSGDSRDFLRMGSDLPPLLIGVGSKFGTGGNDPQSLLVTLFLQNSDGTEREVEFEAPEDGQLLRTLVERPE